MAGSDHQRTRHLSESIQREGPAEAASPGPARLFALLAGAFLALLGVLGFFYDAEFGTGGSLASDDLKGLLNINGWRNVIYLATGFLALAFAARSPRRTAFGLGLFYLVFAVWGFDQTERDIGTILDAVPLGDRDNALHLILGILGLGSALIDGPLPAIPDRIKKLKPKVPSKAKKLKAPKVKLPTRKKKPKAEAKDEPKNKSTDKAKTPATGKKKPSEKKPATGERGSRRPSRADPRPGDAV